MPDPLLPEYLSYMQRPIQRARFNTYRAPGFGTRQLSTTGNVTETPAPFTPPPAPPAGLRGVYAVRSQYPNSDSNTRYGGGGVGGHSANSGGPTAQYNDRYVDVAPGMFSLAGFSTGTGVDRFGGMYDTTVFNPLGLAGTVVGGVAGIPGLGLAGDLAGDHLGLTGGIGEGTRMTGEDGRLLNLFHVLRNPDAYSPREVALARRNLANAQQNIRPAATPAREPASGLGGVTADRGTATLPNGQQIPGPAPTPNRDLTNPGNFQQERDSQTTDADRGTVTRPDGSQIPGPAPTPDRSPVPTPPPPAFAPDRSRDSNSSFSETTAGQSQKGAAGGSSYGGTTGASGSKNK